MMKKTDNNPFEKLAKPAQRALASAGIHSLEALSKHTEAAFMALHGIGKKSLGQLRELLAEKGLQFSQA